MTQALRPMRWWDIDPVMRLEEELFADDAWSAGMFWSELAERDTRSYLVVDADSPGGDVSAYCGLCVYSPTAAYVQTIAVAPSAQGQGLGQRLLTAMLAEADQRGCVQVDLEVRADNAGAQRLYERNGFRSIGVRRGYYQPSGVDAVVMRRAA